MNNNEIKFSKSEMCQDWFATSTKGGKGLFPHRFLINFTYKQTSPSGPN